MKHINNLRMALPATLVLASVAYLGLSVVSLLLSPAHVGASTAPNGSYSQIHLGQGDYVWNWDFNGDKAVPDGVDWGLRFIFHDDAEVDKVKNRLDGKGSAPIITPALKGSGWFQYGAMLDYPDDEAYQFDKDAGIKNDPGCKWNHGHMRVYATSGGDRNFNTSLGYYVVASVHRDHEAPFWCDDQYLSSETHEDWWLDRIEDHLGIDTQYDWTESSFNWHNDVSGYPEISPDDDDDHWYQSDGWGAKIRVPNYG